MGLLSMQCSEFSKTNSYFTNLLEASKLSRLDTYGRKGVEALRAATPVASGVTASSWSYQIVHNAGSVSLEFHNSNIQNGVPIAVILQYGHGTGTGGYVQGRDYINPAMRPIFDEIANQLGKELNHN